MARIQNDDLPMAPQGQALVEHGMQQTGSTYDVKALPKMFGELIGKRIGTTHGDGKYFGCLVKYARTDEFQVEILVQRIFKDPNYNPGIWLRTLGAVVLTMKYEGRIDGIDRFALKGLESWTWTVGVNRYGDVIRQKDQCPNYGIGIFGVSQETLRDDYGTFFRIADAASVETKAGSPKPSELAASDCLALASGCG